MRRNISWILCFLCVVLISILMGARPKRVGSASLDKVNVCHLNDTGSFTLINVTTSALPAHLAHGDGVPGGPVPGGNGLIFDANCTPVNPPPPPTPTPTPVPPPPASFVFVSSQAFQGNLTVLGFVGLSGADESCRLLAESGLSYLHGRTWKAFLSDSATNAATRLTHNPAGYVLVDGTVVAASDTTFFSTSHLHGIDKDENGNFVDGVEVWTGSGGSGVGSGGCANWTSSDPGGSYPPVGISTRSDPGWANVYLQFCDHSERLYCVEQ